MHTVDDVVRLQRQLADALTARDPVAVVQRLAAAGDVAPELLDADPDGLRLAALLVVRLRFERLVQASRAAARWFEQDPAAFTAAFAVWHAEVPPLAADGWLDAAAFADWVQRRAGRGD